MTQTIGQGRWNLQGVSYIGSKCHELWLQIGPALLPTLRKFCIPLYCQASQT